LSFEVAFEYDDDTVYFAFAPPLGYSEVVEQMAEKEKEWF